MNDFILTIPVVVLAAMSAVGFLAHVKTRKPPYLSLSAFLCAGAILLFVLGGLPWVTMLNTVLITVALALYVIAVSVLTCGTLWRRWLVMIGSVVPGGIAVVLASASSSLWLPLFDSLGGLWPVAGVSALVCVLLMSWYIATRVFTRGDVDAWAVLTAERAESLAWSGIARAGSLSSDGSGGAA